MKTAIGGKLGIDTTKKLPGESHKRNWPPLTEMDGGKREGKDKCNAWSIRLENAALQREANLDTIGRKTKCHHSP